MGCNILVKVEDVLNKPISNPKANIIYFPSNNKFKYELIEF